MRLSMKLRPVIGSARSFAAVALLLTLMATADGQAGWAISTSSFEQTPQPSVEGWRYKWHNGHWWYYQANKQWLFWNGVGWSAYSPGTYQRFTRRRRYADDYRRMTAPNGPGFSESGEIYQNRD